MGFAKACSLASSTYSHALQQAQAASTTKYVTHRCVLNGSCQCQWWRCQYFRILVVVQMSSFGFVLRLFFCPGAHVHCFWDSFCEMPSSTVLAILHHCIMLFQYSLHKEQPQCFLRAICLFTD